MDGSTSWSSELSCQPASCEVPISFQCSNRDFQRLRGFRFRQTSEESQLDHFGGASIQCFKLLQSSIDSQQSLVKLPDGVVRIEQGRAYLAAAPFFASEATRVIYQ